MFFSIKYKKTNKNNISAVEQSFSLKKVFEKNTKDIFLSNSSIKVKNLFNQKLCEDACLFFKNNEKKIIDKYNKDSKGLTLDLINNEKFIKYFEY